MSIWYEAKAEDIERDGDEINIHFDNDYTGAMYVIVKVEDIKKAISEQSESLAKQAQQEIAELIINDIPDLKAITYDKKLTFEGSEALSLWEIKDQLRKKYIK